MGGAGITVLPVNGSQLDVVFFSFFFLINLFIYFWLHWVFVAARGLSLVAASGGYFSLRCADSGLGQEEDSGNGWCLQDSRGWKPLFSSLGSLNSEDKPNACVSSFLHMHSSFLESRTEAVST